MHTGVFRFLVSRRIATATDAALFGAILLNYTVSITMR